MFLKSVFLFYLYCEAGCIHIENTSQLHRVSLVKLSTLKVLLCRFNSHFKIPIAMRYPTNGEKMAAIAVNILVK